MLLERGDVGEVSPQPLNQAAKKLTSSIGREWRRDWLYKLTNYQSLSFQLSFPTAPIMGFKDKRREIYNQIYNQMYNQVEDRWLDSQKTTTVIFL